MKPTLLFLIAIIIASCSSKSRVDFPIEKIQSENIKISVLEPSNVFNAEILKIKTLADNQSLTVWEGVDPEMWKNANYLVCEIWHENDYSGILQE
jgi:hypothetical protein